MAEVQSNGAEPEVAVELRIELIEDPDPEKCVLMLNPPALDALTHATSDDEHQALLGPAIMQHLKTHHFYGTPDVINLRHEVRP